MVAAFLNVSEEQTIKIFWFIADEEPVVALTVGNDHQLSRSQIENYSETLRTPATQEGKSKNYWELTQF